MQNASPELSTTNLRVYRLPRSRWTVLVKFSLIPSTFAAQRPDVSRHIVERFADLRGSVSLACKTANTHPLERRILLLPVLEQYTIYKHNFELISLTRCHEKHP